MTHSRFNSLKQALKSGEQSYTVQTGDNLYDLAKALDYVHYMAIWQANPEKITRSDKLNEPVIQAGDTLTLPQYTITNHLPQWRQAQQAAYQAEREKVNRLATARTGVIHSTGQQHWQSVRIFWGNEDIDDLDTTFPFARIHELPHDIQVKGIENAPAVAVLNQEIRINRFENLAGNVILQKQPKKTITWDQGLRAHKELADTHEQATRLQKETLQVPSSQLDKNFDFDDHSGRYGDPSLQKSLTKVRRGRIASAVSQHVIVRIEMSKPVTKPSELPNLDTWAFLQPPTLGGNPYRLNGNNRWVTDDAQKAGWFHGRILGVEAQSIGKNRYKVPLTQFRESFVRQNKKGQDTDAPQKFQFQQVLEARMKVDEQNPRIVYVKYPAIVYNDCSKEDFKQRQQFRLQQEQYEDVISLEVGSYMKIWVRNHTYTWQDDGPTDHYSEDLQNSMEVDDPYLIKRTFDNGKINPAFNPQLCRNHSWRRERLVDGRIETDPDTGKVTEQPVDSAAKSYGDLLYVGLYPAELIDALNHISQPAQPGKPRELNLFNWLGTSVIYVVALNTLKRIMRHAAEKKAARQSISVEAKKHDPKYWEYQYGKTLKKFLSTMMLPELFAVQAVDAFRSNFDMDKALNEIQNIFEKLGDDDELANKLDQIDTSKSNAEIRQKMLDLQLPQAMIERFDIIIAQKTGAALKYALDDKIKTSKDEINIASTFKTTLNVYDHILNFALFDSDNKYLKEEEHKAKNDKNNPFIARLRDRQMSGLFSRLWGRFKHANNKEVFNAVKELIASLTKGDDEHSLSFNTALDLFSFNDARLHSKKNLEAVPIASPLPPPLSFILYSMMIRLQGALPVTLAGQYQKAAKDPLNMDFETLSDQARQEKLNKNDAIVDKGQEFVGMSFGLGSDKKTVTATLEVLFQLQAAWTAAVQRFDDSNSGANYSGTMDDHGLNNMLWGPLIKDVFDYLEISLSVGAKLEVNHNVQWQLAYLFDDELNPNNPRFESQFINRLKDIGGELKVSCPISAKLSVFAWQADIMSAQLATLEKEEATFFDEVTLFGEEVEESGFRKVWGIGAYMDDVLRHYQTPEEVYFGDKIQVVLGAYKRPLDTTFEGFFLWADSSIEAMGEPDKSKKQLVELEDKDFKIERMESYLSKDNSQLTEFKRFNEVVSAALQISFNERADAEIMEDTHPDHVKVVSLSQDPGNTYSISKDNAFWKTISEKEEIYLKSYIKPKNRHYIKLPDNQTIKLKLPVVERIWGHPVFKGQDCLKFSVWFRNFKRPYEHVWIKLEEADTFSGHALDVKIRAWDETDEEFREKSYSDWNLIRMQQDTSDPDKYIVEIPLVGLNPKQLKDEFYSLLEDLKLDIDIQFAYFSGDEYLLAKDLDEKRLVSLSYDTFLHFMK
ncbi:MAG: LysM peptidoglycan-binding domain-containing protein [Reinekea sp.]